ncbi:MAG TPA: glycosyltransferase family 2 protein [Candidatus Paceibacterota bacterium]|nr:glycosyltransferase family 2 protein [Candidatus Paceibacterota bacterium]
MKPFLSVIIPIYNEEGNVIPLYKEIKETSFELLKKKKISGFEVIFVNDGSTDNTQANLENLKKTEKSRLKIIQFRKNFGQTPALKAGFKNAKGDLLVTMDGDLQNDPKDIPKLMDKLDEGYDLVSGWRHNRKDKFTKRISSKIMNFLRKKMIGDNLHDYGCSLKIYKKECVKDLELFGELHRYITAYLYVKGYKIGEVKVNHHPRKSGQTKYKFNRGVNGILDLFYLKFWASFSSRPLHFFGRIGIYQWILAILIVIEQIIKALLIKQLNFGPMLALALMLVLTGLLFIIFGFLSEMMSRSYFKDKEIYSLKKII